MPPHRCTVWYSWVINIQPCSVARGETLSRPSWYWFWIKMARGKDLCDCEGGFIVGAQMAGASFTKTVRLLSALVEAVTNSDVCTYSRAMAKTVENTWNIWWWRSSCIRAISAALPHVMRRGRYITVHKPQCNKVDATFESPVVQIISYATVR